MTKSERKCPIRFDWRRNLIYPIQLLIWTFLRKVDVILLDSLFDFSRSLLFTLIMFLGEFFAGLILYIHQKRFMKRRKSLVKNSIFFPTKKYKNETHDSKLKIAFLIFILSFFDFVEFILSTNYIPKFLNVSGSLEIRLGGILTISAALFFYYLLKLPIFRHQLFSLLIIGVCLILVLVSEFCFQDINIFLSYGEFGTAIVFIFAVHFFNSLVDSIEKYIIEFDVMNYFGVLLLEGLFGFIITLVYSFSDDSYQKQLSKIYSENSGSQFSLFIFLLFAYLILCGGRNAYRVVTDKIYSPMTKTLTDYFLNPFYLTYNYIRGDFRSNGKGNVIYFLINFLLSIFISLCGCVYNDIVILFLCGLERDTYNQVSFRSMLYYKQESEAMIPLEKEMFENDLDSSSQSNVNRKYKK